MAETILIVDDEEQIRSSVRGVLTDEGFRVLEADNGRSALATIAAGRCCKPTIPVRSSSSSSHNAIPYIRKWPL